MPYMFTAALNRLSFPALKWKKNGSITGFPFAPFSENKTLAWSLINTVYNHFEGRVRAGKS